MKKLLFQCGRIASIVALLVALGCASHPEQEAEKIHFQTLFEKGSAYLERRKPQMALKAFLEAKKINPTHVKLLTLMGLAYDQSAQYSLALEVFEQANRLQPENGAISHNMAVALIHANRLVDAEKALKQALNNATFTGRAEAFYNLAIIHERRNQPQEMVHSLQEALAAEPNHVPSHLALADYYRKTGNSALEYQHVKTLLGIKPDDVLIIEQMADFYFRAGEIDQARPLLANIIAQAPDSPAADRAQRRLKHMGKPQ